MHLGKWIGSRLKRLPFVAVVFLVVTAGETMAQVADTLDAAKAQSADTLAISEVQLADTLEGADGQVSAREASLPALDPALDLFEMFADEPGSFTYWFGTPGWPDGWSYRGLPPHSTGLVVEDRPFTHIFTGRPGDQLVPLALVEAPQLGAGPFGRPTAALLRFRSFAAPQPITEAKYWRGGGGLQSIDVVHAQHRRRAVRGRPGFLNVLGAYSGRAANGEYPGSRLRRARQVLLRMRYQQQHWAIEVANLHNRRFVGAHGGVIPDPGDFESIYIRPGATVVNPDARRRIIRNDFWMRGGFDVFGPMTSVSLFWTAEMSRYSLPSDTLGTRADRAGLVVSQPLARTSRHRVSLDASVWRDAIAPEGGFHQPTFTRWHATTALRDSISAGVWRAIAQAGMGAFSGRLHPLGGLSVRADGGFLRANASVQLSTLHDAPVAVTGFGSLSGLDPGEADGTDQSQADGSGSVDDTDGRARSVLQGALAFGIHVGGLDFEMGGFASHIAEPVDYFVIGGDSVAALEPSSALMALGGYGLLRWRPDASRGLYGRLQSTLHIVADRTDPLIARISDTLPRISGRARAGAKFLLFQGDLDANAYVEVVAWSAMRSRSLHPETGLLTVPEGGARILGPSSMVNVAMEAEIRGATLFLIYENVLSGTALMTGNMIVPVYPLPARRFRFGVFWPIFG